MVIDATQLMVENEQTEVPNPPHHGRREMERPSRRRSTTSSEWRTTIRCHRF